MKSKIIVKMFFLKSNKYSNIGQLSRIKSKINK